MAFADEQEAEAELMIALRLTWAILTWIVNGLVISLPLIVLGLFVTPIAILTARAEISPITGKPILNASWLLWLFGNDEDGFDPEWYRATHPEWPRFIRMYAWAALRNSVGNQRFVPILNPRLDPKKVRSLMLKNGWLAWQGPYTRMELPTARWPIGIGWRIYPSDAKGVKPTDWRRWGAGFKLGINRL